MSYLLFAIARLFGRAAAPRIERKWQDSTMDPEKLASRRIAEAMLPQLKRNFGPEGWAFLTQRYENQCGALGGSPTRDPRLSAIQHELDAIAVLGAERNYPVCGKLHPRPRTDVLRGNRAILPCRTP